ncbi:hypothetical protein BD414DRAFT_486367 [Trametes punicea]|nr:hypothetical protein BD414DRAFT_486367 [Trametes punicea]
MDMPNHGRAAILNEHRLLEFPDGLTGAQCAREVNVFLKSGLIASGCSVVAIGHSAGSCILIQSTEDYAVNQLPFSSLIMVEPPMMTPDRLREEIKKGATFLRAIDVARVRKDIWPSRATAKEWFAKRLPWKRWDPRSLDLFIEHGLRDLPTAAYPELQEGVTLTTPREQEAGCYSAYDDAHISMERLKAICHAIPVHCVFSGINDMMSIEAQKDMVDERVGRRMRSVVRVTGAGHLVLQEKPRELALAIWGILHEDYAQRVHLVKARL